MFFLKLTREYNENNTPATIVAWKAVDNKVIDPASQTGTGVVSNNINVPGTTIPSVDLPSGHEYCLVVNFSTAMGGTFEVFQVVTVKVPVEIDTEGNGVLLVEITWENVTPGNKCFN